MLVRSGWKNNWMRPAVTDRNGSVEPAETVVQDIVERLRDWPLRESEPLNFLVVFGDAAEEIELLRTTVDESTAALSRAVMALMCKVDDIVRLRAEIKRLYADAH